MDEQWPSYRGEFLKSPHHAWMGLLTLGLGFMSAQALALILGATAYTLGWIYLPDLPWFKKWVDRRRDHAKRTAALAQLAAFEQRREALLTSLAPTRRERYHALAAVCHTIETAGMENSTAADTATDPRLRKLDELMWTYLRLLTIEESLERFLEIERREELPKMATEAEAERTRLATEIEALKAKGAGSLVAQKQRLLASRQERIEVLRKRLQRIEQARDNLALVLSEQERLDQQIKLIRADAVASKNAGTLTARIDATVEHLDQTNKWIAEMNEFKDLVEDLPDTELRVGFRPTAPPPIITTESRQAKQAGPLPQKQ
jgi:hypothetical protein